MKNTDVEFYAAAISKAESGNLNGALENINRAIELNPNELNYLIYLGFIKYSLGDHEQAIAAYDKYLSYNPNSQPVWINRNIVSQSSRVTTSLELGCGIHHKNPFNARESYGIDIREDLDLNIYKADLAIEAIPFPDNHFDFVVAEHFIEHIPRLIYSPNHRFPFIELMSEIWRVLKPKGLFYAITPAYPHVEAFQDPTHVNIITERTFPAYFCYAVPWAQQYGFKGRFNFTKQDWEGPCLRTWLNKIE
jgi:SAM-dependent methyltransferase